MQCFERRSLIYWLWVLPFMVLVNGCQREEGCLDAGATNYDVSADLNCCCEFPELNLRIFRKAGSSTFSTDSSYLDAGGIAYRISDLRYYISALHLIQADGTIVGVTDSISIDKQDLSNVVVEDNFSKINFDQNLYEVGRILTQGTFTKVSFTLGLNMDVNHSNPDSYPAGHPLDIQSDSLHISQPDGYMFNVMDITVGNSSSLYIVSGDSRTVEVELDYDLTVEKAFDVEIQLDVDLTGFFENVNFVNDDLNTILDKIVINTPEVFSKHE